MGKIMIFGGRLDEEEKTNDFFVFDVRKKTIDKISSDYEYQAGSGTNQNECIDTDKVVSLV